MIISGGGGSKSGGPSEEKKGGGSGSGKNSHGFLRPESFKLQKGESGHETYQRNRQKRHLV